MERVLTDAQRIYNKLKELHKRKFGCEITYHEVEILVLLLEELLIRRQDDEESK